MEKKEKKEYLYPQITFQSPVDLKERLLKAKDKFEDEKGIAKGSLTFSKFIVNLLENYLKEQGF
jgi:hypothetical protein